MPGGVNRRRVVGGVAAVTAMPLIAACGDSESSVGADAPATSSGSSSPSQGAPSGEVIATTSEVPVGSGIVDSGRQMVISQPAEGEFKAFSNICTHQGCPMSRVEGDEIVCGCHFSKFSLVDGSVLSGDADSDLEEFSVSVDGENIILG